MTEVNASNAELKQIDVDLIDRNPENPRIIFRGDELHALLGSIRRYGVQVPISVYKEGRRFVLIDGERRWRCSIKLNRQHIPALVQERPTALDNLLLMFSIHALREQWDLLTMAVKLPRIIELLTERLQRRPNEGELSDHTGLSRSTIRRCKLLVDLPQQHLDSMLLELKKPKAEQKLTEDFFIEMERALKTVERAMPDVVKNKERARTVLIDKYQRGVIVNRTDFRYLAKIARAEKVKADTEKAATVLDRVLQSNEYSPARAYRDSVSEAYSERDILSRVDSLLERLEDIHPEEIDEKVRNQLKALVARIRELLASS